MRITISATRRDASNSLFCHAAKRLSARFCQLSDVPSNHFGKHTCRCASNSFRLSRYSCCPVALVAKQLRHPGELIHNDRNSNLVQMQLPL